MTDLDLVALARIEFALMGDPFRHRVDYLYGDVLESEPTQSQPTPKGDTPMLTVSTIRIENAEHNNPRHQTEVALSTPQTNEELTMSLFEVFDALNERDAEWYAVMTTDGFVLTLETENMLAVQRVAADIRTTLAATGL